MKLQATGNSTKPDAQKVDPLLNHNGERGIEIYRNVHFAQRLQAPKKAKNNFEFLEKTGTITPPRLASLMLILLSVIPQSVLRENFWLHLKRDPEQSFDSLVNTFWGKA